MKTGKFCPAPMLGSLVARSLAAAVTPLDVRHDLTGERYRRIGKAFATRWNTGTGEDPAGRQSDGGSGVPARSVIGRLLDRIVDEGKH